MPENPKVSPAASVLSRTSVRITRHLQERRSETGASPALATTGTWSSWHELNVRGVNMPLCLMMTALQDIVSPALCVGEGLPYIRVFKGRIWICLSVPLVCVW